MNSYSYRLTAEQYLASVQYKAARSASRLMRIAGYLSTAVLYGAFGALITASYMGRTLPGKVVFAMALVGLLALLALSLVSRAAFSSSIRRSTFMAGREHAMTVGDDGVRFTTDAGDVSHPWTAFESVEERNGIVYLHLDNVHFHPIPASAFDSDAVKAEFIALALERIGKKGGESQVIYGPSSTPLPTTESTHDAPRISWWRRVRDAFRLAFFLDVPRERLAASWSTIAAIAIAGAAIPSLPLLISAPLAGGWNWYAIPGALFHLPLILIAAVALAAATEDREDVSRMLLAGCLAAIVIDVLTMVLNLAAGSVPGNVRGLLWSTMWIPGAWLGLAIATYAGRQVPKSVRRLGVVVASILLISVPLANTYRDRSVWHGPYDAETMKNYKEGGVAGEDNFYKQASLLDQELDAIRPGTRGVVDVFFIGMAGYGRQDVFMREVNSVAELFRDRFRTDGRTVRLINNPKTLLDTPIASKTSLRKALTRISSSMDKEEDVLVLFMTSHGNANEFSLELWPMTFHDIDPIGLRALLDESGIRNRVIILSACYSGSFVKALEDPNTLVITASAPDKNSFGCSNEADWTYFGKAYFDDALRKTYSFKAAFEMARPTIEARETHDGFDHSEPQISAGTAIAGTLDRLAAQLGGGAPSPLPSTSPNTSQRDPYEIYAQVMFNAEYLNEMLSACRQNMSLSSPQETLKKYPDSYAGMEKSPRHWNRLMESWQRYSESVCQRSLDPQLVRRLYVESSRRVMSQADVEEALRLLETPEGRRWIERDREASRRQQLELARAQVEISSSLYNKFREEQDQAYKDFKGG